MLFPGVEGAIRWDDEGGNHAIISVMGNDVAVEFMNDFDSAVSLGWR
jgi:hypothetical protein